MAIARRYELFNGALQIPQFTSEDEVLSAGASIIMPVLRFDRMLETSDTDALVVASAGELELVWNAIANHRSYLDQGFVRKMTARTPPHAAIAWCGG